MPTCRTVINEALRSIKALAPGDEMTADESVVALEALQNVVIELHEGRGPLMDVDVQGGYIAGENQRIRVQAGDTVTVDLPNSVAMITFAISSYDYGFANLNPIPQGSQGVADGVNWRQPYDGARIEVIGTGQNLYFYRSDINQWVQAYGLTLDAEIPLNGRYASSLSALVAERCMEQWPSRAEPTSGMARRIAKANSMLRMRSGAKRDPQHGNYF